ncbi:hypothetical protein EIN_503100 [Entamoeba invadens IP1]|uniref:Uncharacterized protein n=1 Tax=Entamoeba invadens IP1 TaxID=370355 RepID=A0A0A1U7F0_ENTIV|nr:hypothetical protein EIN_503100 [Entamoeba invadens IP1]ELP90264.1 hypothetical protein EIN_503100 [Entamoeba invadens IP1]|eukprot:XP_004257035.1 hypothetical protein EIN_503100 [Entamoeba invadens IP1]
METETPSYNSWASWYKSTYTEPRHKKQPTKKTETHPQHIGYEKPSLLEQKTTVPIKHNVPSAQTFHDGAISWDSWYSKQQSFTTKEDDDKTQNCDADTNDQTKRFPNAFKNRNFRNRSVVSAQPPQRQNEGSTISSESLLVDSNSKQRNEATQNFVDLTRRQRLYIQPPQQLERRDQGVDNLTTKDVIDPSSLIRKERENTHYQQYTTPFVSLGTFGGLGSVQNTQPLKVKTNELPKPIPDFINCDDNEICVNDNEKNSNITSKAVEKEHNISSINLNMEEDVGVEFNNVTNNVLMEEEAVSVPLKSTTPIISSDQITEVSQAHQMSSLIESGKNDRPIETALFTCSLNEQNPLIIEPKKVGQRTDSCFAQVTDLLTEDEITDCTVSSTETAEVTDDEIDIGSEWVDPKSVYFFHSKLREIHPIMQHANILFSLSFVETLCRYGEDLQYWPEESFNVLFDKRRLQGVVTSYIRSGQISHEIMWRVKTMRKVRLFLAKLQCEQKTVFPFISRNWCDNLFEDKHKNELAQQWSFTNDLELIVCVCTYGVGVYNLYIQNYVINTILETQFGLYTLHEKTLLLERRLIHLVKAL